ncbi:MAG: helix-hairpin-helix domain-containing protein [Cocleimonas sp.]
MTFFLCKLWPYLAGGLIGWLLAGWLARRFKHAEPSLETIVEKRVEVDNPNHLALISKLEGENSKIATLMSKVSAFESRKPEVVEKTVVKKVEVDNPEHLALISKLKNENSELAGLRSKITTFETQGVRLKKLEEENAQIVGLQSKLKSFETARSKTIDNPQHLALIDKLEKENKEIVVLRTRLSTFETQESKLNSKISDLENVEPRIVEKEIEKLVDNPEHLKTISSLEDEVAIWKRGPQLDLPAAKSAGINIKDESDLTAVEGIGPKISELLHANGIKSLKDLADADTSDIQQALNTGGSQYQMANPGTWSDQANLACNNRWPALKALQDVLDGGVYPDASVSASNVAKIKQLEGKVAAWEHGPKVDIVAAKAAGISIAKENDFTAIEGIGPQINVLIHAGGIHSFKELSEADPSRIQKILDDAGSNFKMANPGTWPDQANLACNNRWSALKALQDVLDGGVYPDGSKASVSGSAGDATKVKQLEAELASFRKKEEESSKTTSVADADKAKAAGFTMRQNGSQDDFTVIEGIGPKINDLIHADGIHTFNALADIDISIIQKILDKAGSSFKLADPETWSAQSDLAAKNEWEKLMKWQDELDGGKS